MNKPQLHKIEMDLVWLLEENKLTRDAIIDHFTKLMGELKC